MFERFDVLPPWLAASLAVIVALSLVIAFLIHAWKLGRSDGQDTGGSAMVKIAAALLVALLLPAFAFAQDPAPAPSPAPKLTTVQVLGGPASVSLLDELKPYALLRVEVRRPLGKNGFRAFARGDVDRTQDGGAFSIADLTTFASIRASAGILKRVNSSLSIGAAGGVTWSRESGIKSPADPRLWTGVVLACLDRFEWWPDGGTACAGFGQHGPAGGPAGVFSVTIPVKGGVQTVIDFDLPVNKLPDFIRALPGVVAAAPLQKTAPTPEQLAGVRQRLPIAIRVGVIVPLKTFGL